MRQADPQNLQIALPTYDVFDEDRYFQPRTRVELFDVRAENRNHLRGYLAEMIFAPAIRL